MTRKKIIKRVFYSLLIALLSFALVIGTIILYPQPLFANKVEYRHFKVYSNQKIGDEVKPILDGARSLVQNSELYDTAYTVDVFLSYNTFFNRIDDKVFGYGATARTIGNNLVVKVAVDIKKNIVYTTFPKTCEQRFTYLIAHEMTHCLQTHKYGMLKFNPLNHPEMWKLEGYPEYVARHKVSNPIDSLKKDINKFLELKGKQTNLWISEDGACEVPEVYYKGRLMMEYLINVRHLSYDQILKDKRSETKILSEMIEWMTK